MPFYGKSDVNPKFRFNVEAVFEDDSKTEETSDIFAKLHRILGPFMLRRLKTDVIADLPPKREVVVYCPFTKPQRAFYELLVQRDIKKIIEGGVGLKSSVAMKNMLMQLRKVICTRGYPYLAI